MKVAHLIMVHKNPGQIERLIRTLQHEDFDFYLHLDKKANMNEYAYLAQLPHVQFIQKRFWVRWASYRFTEAILQGVREILATNTKYDFINLLSGQDYPIKPVASIHKFLAKHVGFSFLSFEREGSPWWDHAISRIQRYHTTYFDFKGQYKLQAILNTILPKRNFPLPYTLFGGPNGSWWTMGIDCAKYLIDFIDANTNLHRFSYFTWGSDEFLIATILMNSPLKNQVVNNNYRYIDWSEGEANPKILTINDASKLVDTQKLFARKFDTTHDNEVLDLIDQSLLNTQTRIIA